MFKRSITAAFPANLGSRAAILVTAMALFISAFPAAAVVDPKKCRHEISSELVLAKQRLENSNFVVNRNYGGYRIALRSKKEIPRINTLLTNLPDGALVMDSGAGYAVALRKIIINSDQLGFKKLNGLAVGYEIPTGRPELNLELAKDLLMYPDRLNYVSGGFVENMINGKLALYKGKVDLLIEVWGPLVYTSHFLQLLNAYADLLKVGGQALLHVAEAKTIIQIKSSSDSHAVPMRFRDFHRLLPILTGGRLIIRDSGVRHDDQGGEFVGESILWIEKVKDGPAPKDLRGKLTQFIEGAPPWRFFLIEPAETVH